MTVEVQEHVLSRILGVAANPDQHYGLQCVDLADWYAEQLFGVPWAQCLGPVAGARDLMDVAPDKYWTKIWNDGSVDLIPQRGDVVIYEGWGANQWGHVGIPLQADQDGTNLAQQDGFAPPLIFVDGGWYSNKPAHEARYDYSLGGVTTVRGWLRPKLEGLDQSARPAGQSSPQALSGIDIASHQAGINLDAVPADFVIVKATGGTWYENPELGHQFDGADGKLRGLYHFAREGQQAGPVEEAQHFLSRTRNRWDGNTVPVLDWEADNVHDVGWAKTWLDTVAAALNGVKPLIYMNLNAAMSHDWSSVIDAGYKLWLAQYPSSARQGYGPLAGRPNTGRWSTIMWQYTQSGSLPGYAGGLDLNVFYGSHDDWLALAGGKPVEPKIGAVVTPVVVDQTGSYTVQAGDMLSLIAERFGVSLEALVQANRIANADRIDVGQILVIPRGGTAVVETGNVGMYVVQGGDSLTSIAQRFGTTVPTLVALNGLANADLIHVGQTLKVPGSAAAPVAAGARTHTVQAGEYLSSIAALYGTDWQTLASRNGITNPDLIQPGQVLTISGSGGARVHTVQAGESLSSIAAAYGSDWQTLAAHNGIANPDVIQPGQQIRIP
ncbi:LysM peptidoglycan-binding domain-containing protein [Arthrobacter sp. B1805]|uniref:LysM peptidoglycan-binding domain-containing protein n=1 Tax=Arthrobacter sp. B1805 TaxID=2058892 RepID=UPI0011B0612C|nr:LysM peptidoglycan-binding domain-containing protein [Arthrobacter sp. B1805]